MKKILYFSRGRGYGHSVTDLIIKNKINYLFPEVEIILASYCDGLSVMKQSSVVNVLELDINLENEYSRDSFNSILSAIKKVDPDLIISHEMFYAVFIAEKFSIPSILITHWFFEQVNPTDFFGIQLQTLFNCADDIVIIDLPDYHKVPRSINKPVSFVGPVIREYNQSLENRFSIREMLGINVNVDLLCLSLGGGYKESKHLARTTIEAFKVLNDSTLGLVFMAGPEYKNYKPMLEGYPNVYIGTANWDEYMDIQAASDFAITRGTFTTMCELASIGLPSISIIDGINAVDTFHADNFSKLGITINVPSSLLNVNFLINLIKKIRGRKKVMKLSGESYKKTQGIDRIADIISKYIVKTK